jgi:serine/threonine protein kinase
MTAPSPALFNLAPGRILAGKYIVDEYLGGGWEGEVYRVIEEKTDLVRAAKLFYPERNPRDETVRRYARKLERLRYCPAVMQYHHSETIQYRRRRVTCLFSEFVDGERLPDLLARQRGKRLRPFEALHLLATLAEALRLIHLAGEYHGDLHPENVLVRRRGIYFDIKLLDFFHQRLGRRQMRHEDLADIIRLFYDALGGRRHYASQPPEVKYIVCGLKRSLIARKFPDAARLCEHLSSFSWQTL